MSGNTEVTDWEEKFGSVECRCSPGHSASKQTVWSGLDSQFLNIGYNMASVESRHVSLWTRLAAIRRKFLRSICPRGTGRQDGLTSRSVGSNLFSSRWHKYYY